MADPEQEDDRSRAEGPKPCRTVHLTPGELARRWRLSPRTLERWRWLGHGPSYLRIGRHVLYDLADIEAYERARRRRTDNRPAPEGDNE